MLNIKGIGPKKIHTIWKEMEIESLGELLRDIEAGEEAPLLPPPRQEFRYDLCPECHERFVRDPFGKEQPQKLSFSKN